MNGVRERAAWKGFRRMEKSDKRRDPWISKSQRTPNSWWGLQGVEAEGGCESSVATIWPQKESLLAPPLKSLVMLFITQSLHIAASLSVQWINIARVLKIRAKIQPLQYIKSSIFTSHYYCYYCCCQLFFYWRSGDLFQSCPRSPGQGCRGRHHLAEQIRKSVDRNGLTSDPNSTTYKLWYLESIIEPLSFLICKRQVTTVRTWLGLKEEMYSVRGWST